MAGTPGLSSYPSGPQNADISCANSADISCVNDSGEPAQSLCGGKSPQRWQEPGAPPAPGSCQPPNSLRKERRATQQLAPTFAWIQQARSSTRFSLCSSYIQKKAAARKEEETLQAQKAPKRESCGNRKDST